MSSSSKFSYVLRKHPLVRFLLLVLAIAIVFFFVFYFSNQKAIPPVVYSINPPVGSAGDILTITGSGFGNERDDSYVEMGGSRLTMSSYVQWSDDIIKVVLPETVQDGLVVVVTMAGESEPKIFANKSAIPVVVPPDSKTSLPKITSIDKSTVNVGEMVTITGKNFGSMRNTSQVFFSTNTESTPSNLVATTGLRLACSENDYDYEFWSDEEIRIRVPDGVVSGNVLIVTDKGESNAVRVNVSNTVGTKQFTDRHTYIVNISVDIADAIVKEDSTLTLRVPYPPISSMQRSVEMTSCTPEPVISNYLNTIVHQVALKKNTDEKDIQEFVKKTFSHVFLVTTYGVETKVNERQVTQFQETSRLVYTANVRADGLIKSDSETAISLAKSITGREQNPYRIASLIYNYMLDNYEVLSTLGNGETDPLDIITEKKGDAYDFTMLYCTLMHASGIPCLPIAGILVDSNLNSRSHWWTEFYIEKLGWIPVDIVLGYGMEYSSFKENSSPRDYYFGNIDGQHIAFSRGWNVVKPATLESKTVYMPKTYALQSIWEEATSGIERYSSYWSDAYVTGVY